MLINILRATENAMQNTILSSLSENDRVVLSRDGVYQYRHLQHIPDMKVLAGDASKRGIEIKDEHGITSAQWVQATEIAYPWVTIK